MRGFLALVAIRVPAVTVLTSTSFLTPSYVRAQALEPGSVLVESGPPRASPPAENRAAEIAAGGLISITRAGHRVPQTAKVFFKRALDQEKKDQKEEALASLLHATSLDPLYWEAQAHLADLYWRAGQKQLALGALNAALAIDDNSEILLTNKAIALLGLDEPEAAEQAASRALHIEPDSGQAHYLIGLAQMRRGAVTSETLEHVTKAIGSVPQAGELCAKVQAILANPR